MTGNRRLIAEVPPAHRKEGICWLVIEYDEKGSGGWFLFGYRALNEGSEFDTWHQTKSDAQKQAATQWGVEPGVWRADLRKVK